MSERLTELELACPRCLDSTLITVVDPGQTSSGEDQDKLPLLKCSHGCLFTVAPVALDLIPPQVSWEE